MLHSLPRILEIWIVLVQEDSFHTSEEEICNCGFEKMNQGVFVFPPGIAGVRRRVVESLLSGAWKGAGRRAASM